MLHGLPDYVRSELPEPCDVPKVAYMFNGKPICQGEIMHCPYFGSDCVCLKQETEDLDEPGNLGPFPIMLRVGDYDIAIITNKVIDKLPERDREGNSTLKDFLGRLASKTLKTS